MKHGARKSRPGGPSAAPNPSALPASPRGVSHSAGHRPERSAPREACAERAGGSGRRGPDHDGRVLGSRLGRAVNRVISSRFPDHARWSPPRAGARGSSGSNTRRDGTAPASRRDGSSPPARTQVPNKVSLGTLSSFSSTERLPGMTRLELGPHSRFNNAHVRQPGVGGDRKPPRQIQGQESLPTGCLDSAGCHGQASLTR